jgi:hypothetical protein
VLHVEIPVKVNAWVDENIAPLVVALNSFHHIQTVDSCQGGEDRPAHVMFRYVGKGGARFFYAFGKQLSEKAAKTCSYDFRLQWLTGNEEPLAELWTEPSNVRPLATAISSMAATAHGRKRPSPHDSRGTTPRSSRASRTRQRPTP